VSLRIAAPTPHDGKARAAFALPLPSASRDASIGSHRGTHRHPWFGTTRIAQNERAPMNRSADFPDPCVVVLRRRRDPAGQQTSMSSY